MVALDFSAATSQAALYRALPRTARLSCKVRRVRLSIRFCLNHPSILILLFPCVIRELNLEAVATSREVIGGGRLNLHVRGLSCQVEASGSRFW